MVVFGVVAVAAYAVRLGPIGRRLQIVRDSPLAASTLGVNLTVTKLVVFAVCGMVAALGGAFYGALQQAITPLDFLWSTSLTLLLLVVLGGRSVISGAVIAGAVFGVEKMISNPQINQYLPLAIALGVIALAQEPEGTVALARRETLRVLSVLRPCPGEVVGEGARSRRVPRWRWRPAGPGWGAVMDSELGPGETVLLAGDITVRFGGLIALEEVSLEVPPGASRGSSAPTGPGRRPCSTC